MTVVAVLTNLPDSESAFNLARRVVELRLAACVNVLAPATSFYRWDGRVQRAGEVPLVMKTTAERYPELERFLREAHPDDLPEIIALPVTAGLDGYLGWVADQCKPAPDGTPPK